MEDAGYPEDFSSPLDLDSFCVSEKFGFLLENPLTDLPEYYQPWMDLARNLPALIQNHQLRDRVEEMPLLSTHLLGGHREQRLAHLALGFLTMGYVWQEGEDMPAKILPSSLAVPFHSVSDALGLPPILVYADSVLANWRLKDPKRPMEIGNLDTLFIFPGGDTSKGFFLVSILVEQAASTGLQAMAMVTRSLSKHNVDRLFEALVTVRESLRKMRECFQLVHRHVDPSLYHGTLRVFFSGWRDNPSLPDGLMYEGVDVKPLCFSGGSAAQSSSVQCFDALLGIGQADDEASLFLVRMRDYMPPAHRRLIQTLSREPSLRQHVISSSDPRLRRAYNACVLELAALRGYHLGAVARYVAAPASKVRGPVCPFRGTCSVREGRGTGGSDALLFLRAVLDSTRKALIPEEHPCLIQSRGSKNSPSQC